MKVLFTIESHTLPGWFKCVVRLNFLFCLVNHIYDDANNAVKTKSSAFVAFNAIEGVSILLA